jgi:hypothetical protein
MPSNYPLAPDSDDLRLAPGMRRVVVDTPSAKEIRDLAGLRRDFGLTTAFLDFYIASDIEGDAASPSQIDALWIAAVTMYGRAFASGQRHVGHADTSTPNSIDIEEHKYFIDLRNKYIAHAVNGFEKSTVFADITDPAHSPPAIARIGESHISLSRLSRERAETLNRLCRHQIEELTRRINELHQEVARELLLLGQEAVYSMDHYVPATLDGSNPRSQRK